MALQLKVEITNKEIIKPSSPTPQDLKTLNLSLLDQLASSVYTPLVLFYPKNDNTHEPKTISDHLKASLSTTLSRFYPLAGKAKDNKSVECNDDGADFIEARANCLLSEILEKPCADQMKKLLPIDIESNEASSGRMLLIQTTFFECGGMAIGVSMSHKIADASSMTTFIKAWSATSRNSGDDPASVIPQFIGVSLLPTLDFSMPTSAVELAQDIKCVTRRFVFDSSKLIELKAMASGAGAGVLKPTRVESVTALIWKCAMKLQPLKFTSFLSQTVNLRKRLTPPLPDHSIGNLLGYFMAETPTKTKQDKTELHDFVKVLRDGINEFNEKGVKRYQGENAIR